MGALGSDMGITRPFIQRTPELKLERNIIEVPQELTWQTTSASLKMKREGWCTPQKWQEALAGQPEGSQSHPEATYGYSIKTNFFVF